MPLNLYALVYTRTQMNACMWQGDWVLPSSREALDCDSAWNQLLRQALPGLFAQ